MNREDENANARSQRDRSSYCSRPTKKRDLGCSTARDEVYAVQTQPKHIEIDAAFENIRDCEDIMGNIYSLLSIVERARIGCVDKGFMQDKSRPAAEVFYFYDIISDLRQGKYWNLSLQEAFQLVKWTIISCISPYSFQKRSPDGTSENANYGIGLIKDYWFDDRNGYDLDMIQTELSRRNWWHKPMIIHPYEGRIDRRGIMDYFRDANAALRALADVETRVSTTASPSFNALENMFLGCHEDIRSRSFSLAFNCIFSHWRYSAGSFCGYRYAEIDDHYECHLPSSFLDGWSTWPWGGARVPCKLCPYVEIRPIDNGDRPFRMRYCRQCNRFKEWCKTLENGDFCRWCDAENRWSCVTCTGVTCDVCSEIHCNCRIHQCAEVKCSKVICVSCYELHTYGESLGPLKCPDHLPTQDGFELDSFADY